LYSPQFTLRNQSRRQVSGSETNGPRAFNNPWIEPGGNHTQDLDGTPDLVVDASMLASSWVAREEDFVAGECSVEEGNIPTGTHRSLRFSVLIVNESDADLYVGDPLKHMDPNGDGNYADQDGLFEFASCHAHFHFRNYAKYELLRVNADGSLGSPVQSRKRGFCMLDTTPSVSDNSPPRTNCPTWTFKPSCAPASQPLVSTELAGGIPPRPISCWLLASPQP